MGLTLVPQPFQYGGQPLSLSWFATVIVHPVGGGSEALCGGVLISPSWVATAGHCLQNAEAVTAYVHGEQAASQRLVVSAAFQPAASDAAQDDVALVRLATPSSVAPPALDVTGLAWSALPDGAPLLSAGHGLSCKVRGFFFI